MALNRKWSISRFVVFLILLAFALAAIGPLLYMLFNSLKTTNEYFMSPLTPPSSFYLENYQALFLRFPLGRYFANTIICVVGAFILSQLLTIPAAFAFAKLQFKRKHLYYTIMIGMMAVPGMTFIIPNYLFMSKLGLIDSYWAVIILWGVLSTPNNVFLMTSLMSGLPNEILEASRVDGANYFRTMITMVIPLSLPAIVTMAIFNATTWYNDLLTPLVYFQSDNMKTITVAVATVLDRYNTDFPLLLAGLVLTSLPTIIVYLLVQGYIRKGMTIGAVK